MRLFLYTSLLLASSHPICVQGRIFFPEEVVSLLSFVYSILPPFKIGKDSRFGAGFRVGPNADFQVLIELGPQSETQPIGPGAGSKRDARANTKSEQLNSQKKNPRKSLKRMKDKIKKNTNSTEHTKSFSQTSTNIPLKESQNSTNKDEVKSS